MPDPVSSILDSRFLKQLERLSLVPRRPNLGQMKGEKRSVKHGTSVEFADFREYTLGDDLRYVDWKAYGRLEKLFVKLFVDEEDLSLHLLLDTSPSMDFGAPMSKMEYSRRVAAALGYIALADFDRVSVGSASSRASAILPPTRGKPGIRPFMDFISRMTLTSGETHLGDTLTAYAGRARRGGVAIVLSDFYDESYAHGLKALLARRLQVVMLHVLTPEERDPTVTGDVRLVDSESGAVRDVSVSGHVLGLYRKKLDQFTDGLRETASRYGMDYVPINTSVPFEDVIIHALRQQGILR